MYRAHARICTADEKNFVCGRNQNRLRTKFFSTADEIWHHCPAHTHATAN